MTDALAYFSAKLAHETDASDVYEAQRAAEPFVFVDVRSAEAWAQGHAVGAVHMPHREIAARAPEEIDRSLDVVVYCWSPGCNGGTRAAIELAKLGYRVREMIGGFEYWAREGYPVEDADGVHHRPVDPLTGIPRIRSRS